MRADPYKSCAYTIGVKLSERDGGFKKVFEIGSLEMEGRGSEQGLLRVWRGNVVALGRGTVLHAYCRNEWCMVLASNS